MKRIALFLVMSTVFFAPVLRAQFGNINQKLKEKAQELLKEGQEEAKEKLVEEADKKRASFDTTSFMYAIAFLDKTEPFADKQKGESLMKTAHFVIKDEEDKSIAEQARDLYELGRINYSARRYFLAETSLKAALGLYAIGNDDTDPVYLKTLGTLGLLYSDMGRYDKAAEHTTLALEGWERSMGKESSGYAAEFNNKGVLLLNQADYNQAEKQMRAAIGLIRQKEGENSVPFAIALNNLGILFQYMGRSDEALRQLDRCLEISEELLRDKSSTYLQLLTNKALVLQENGKYGEAEAIYKQALDLQVSRMKVNRKSDPDYAHMLTNLASLYVRTGRSDEAGELFAESLAIYKGKFGVSHPLTASAQSDLGNWYRFEGRYEEALPLLSTSLATRISVFGENHPHTIQSREDLAIVYWKKGEINKADELFDLVMDHSLSFINEFFPPMSEAEKTKYWEKLKPRFFTYFNFAFSQNSPSLLAKALDYRLATKGLLLSSTTRIKNAILSGSDAALVALYTTWQDQKRMLASFYSLSREEVEQQNLNIDSLERAANESERMLSQRSSQFASAFVAKDRTFHQVNNALLAGQAVVEIIQYPFFENSLTDEHRYAALIIQKNGPELVIMENGNQLETRYYSYFKNAIGQKIADKYSYDQYWAKIGTKLQGAGTVFVSPDGVYNQVNLNAFRMADGGFLVQQKDIRIIGNPYDLVESRKVSSGAKSAFLLGYPTYGNGEIVPLPGTREEVIKVESSLATRYQVRRVMQQQATEQSLKQLTSPKILHIATHGFFLEDVKSPSGNVWGVQVEYARNNPLLRSGLILAGAAGGSDKGASFDDGDNGILTAYEAMNMELTGTDLVVLSACETGKGDVKAGEGVYGLQRAFAVAGAHYLVMSLWKVDDKATQQLMTYFYDYWAAQGQEPVAAFRRAQLDLMKAYPDPYFWGAFVMVGQ